MTDNISRMYELAKVEKEYYSFKTEKEEFTWELDENGNDKHNCIFCGEPEIKTRHFTPAKQLELIKWIAINGEVCRIDATEKDKWFIENDFKTSECFADFSQALAGLVCELWEDFTEQQREEIKRVLE